MEERKDEMVMGGFQNALSIYVVEGESTGRLCRRMLSMKTKGRRIFALIFLPDLFIM